MSTTSSRFLRAIIGILAVGLAFVLVIHPGISSANDLNRDLLIASMKGDVEKVASLLDRGADVNAKDQRGWTALEWALRAGHQNVAKLLVDRGADRSPEIPIRFREQLMKAVKSGDPGEVRTLLDKGPNPNLDRFLKHAVARGNPEIVQLLLEKGADPNGNDKCWGYRLLVRAAGEGRPEIVKMLLAKGADVDIKNLDGQTALMWAVWQDNPESVKALLDAEADVNAKDERGLTPIMWAAFGHGGLAEVKLLIDKGADVNARDKFGWSALTYGGYHSRPDVVKLLKDKMTRLTLMDVACLGDVSEIERLIREGADVNEKSGPGNITPLMGATKNGHFDAAKLLLDKGADVNAAAGDLTVLAGAAREGHLEIVKLLLEKGADVLAEASPGWTALNMAQEGGHEEIAQFLKAHGAKE